MTSPSEPLQIAAPRLVLALAASLLALAVLASSAAAHADHPLLVAARSGLAVSAVGLANKALGQPFGHAAIPTCDIDEPGEDGCKLARLPKAPQPLHPAGAPLRCADPPPDGMAATLPDRPPRA